MNNNTERLVYLAGPITGLTFDIADDWRKEAKKLLKPPITGLSPLRCKEYLCNEKSLSRLGYTNHPLSTPAGITSRDRFDCQRCDVVLFNFLGAKCVSIGTCIEVGWADSARRPMVAVIEQGNPHEHAMVKTCIPFIVPTLQDAIDLIHAILLP